MCAAVVSCAGEKITGEIQRQVRTNHVYHVGCVRTHTQNICATVAFVVGVQLLGVHISDVR